MFSSCIQSCDEENCYTWVMFFFSNKSTVWNRSWGGTPSSFAPLRNWAMFSIYSWKDISQHVKAIPVYPQCKWLPVQMAPWILYISLYQGSAYQWLYDRQLSSCNNNTYQSSYLQRTTPSLRQVWKSVFGNDSLMICSIHSRACCSCSIEYLAWILRYTSLYSNTLY